MLWIQPISDYAVANERLLAGYDIIIDTGNSNPVYHQKVLDNLQKGVRGKPVPFLLTKALHPVDENHLIVSGAREDVTNEDCLHLLKEV